MYSLGTLIGWIYGRCHLSRWICMLLNWGFFFFLLCFKAKLRQAAQFSPSYQTPKFVFFQCVIPHATLIQEVKHRTTKMEEGQKGNSTTWTNEQRLVYKEIFKQEHVLMCTLALIKWHQKLSGSDDSVWNPVEKSVIFRKTTVPSCPNIAWVCRLAWFVFLYAWMLFLEEIYVLRSK